MDFVLGQKRSEKFIISLIIMMSGLYFVVIQM